MSGQIHAPTDLSPGKSPRYPLDRRLGGPQSQFGLYGERKNLSLRDSNSDLSVVQPVAQSIPTALSWLQNKV
jgi:hypothetical protein